MKNAHFTFFSLIYFETLWYTQRFQSVQNHWYECWFYWEQQQPTLLTIESLTEHNLPLNINDYKPYIKLNDSLDSTNKDDYIEDKQKSA